MKRYILFGGGCFYPSGGYSDYIDSFESENEARSFIRAKGDTACEWYQIFDDKEKKIILDMWDGSIFYGMIRDRI